MSSSNVRSIESLVAFRGGMLKLSGNWDKVLQDLRMSIQRCETYFTDEQPRYWRHQTQLAERELTEAKDVLSQKQSVGIGGDRPPATEAVQRVNAAKRRLDFCRDRQRKAKAIAVEMSQQCDEMLGPLADVAEHCEVILPTAATKLQALIDQLQAYAEQSEKS